MRCVSCHFRIDHERAEFIKEFSRPQVCRECSTERRAVGFMDYGHKTAPQLVMCSANATETIRILHRANRRAR
jgi:hypothetical protein